MKNGILKSLVSVDVDKVKIAATRALASIPDATIEEREKLIQRLMLRRTGWPWARRNWTRGEAENWIEVPPEDCFERLDWYRQNMEWREGFDGRKEWATEMLAACRLSKHGNILLTTRDAATVASWMPKEAQ